MANPMTATQFVALLDKWGIPHRENRANWQNHNRNSKGEWGPVNGIGNHHTGGNDDKSGRDVLWNGYGDLPGPLCHAGIQQDGFVLLNGWGRVNHFGLGDSDILNHVITEDYTGRLVPHKANVDGNSRFYGFEWMYNGLSDPSTHYPKLYETAVRLNAAINTYHNWGFRSSIAHGEWQPGKWDPGYKKGLLFDVVDFRSHVSQAMKEGPKKPLPTRPTTKPKTKQITVVKGDTFVGLAKKYYPTAKTPGDAVIDLIASNPQLLQPGDKLIVPNV
jgi:LysM repeat protein